MAYCFETEDFSFSSNNHLKVETVKRWFTEGGLTVEKIKNNKVADRHPLMVSLTLWGHCPLAFDYWKARDKKQEMKKDYVESFPKLSSARVFAKGIQGDEAISEKLYNLTSWKF